MTTVDPGIFPQGPPLHTDGIGRVTPSSPSAPLKVRWDAIFLGGLLALAVQIMLTFLGGGIGLSVFDASPEPRPIGVGAGVYVFLSLAASFAVGGWAASYFARPWRRGAAVLHGLGTWSVASSLALILLAPRLGALSASASLAVFWGLVLSGLAAISGALIGKRDRSMAVFEPTAS